MMIWFAGILQNACCNNANKNKTTTGKTLSCECGLLTQLRAFTDVKCRVNCSTVKTQTTNFSISGTSKIIYFCGFLALPPLFFRRLMETSHLGAPIRDLQSHMAFFYVILFFFLDAFLKKRMAALSFSKWKWSDDCRAWNCYIKVIVIELCVIKSWWKIKFNKQKKFISLFLSFKPVLNNLNCCNGVAFQK